MPASVGESRVIDGVEYCYRQNFLEMRGISDNWIKECESVFRDVPEKL